MASPGKFIPLSGKHEVFIIGDIHGCLNTLTHLLEKINYREGSPLFFMGDYSTKAPAQKRPLISLSTSISSIPPFIPCSAIMILTSCLS